jgi:shikimate dehydrogenase
MAGTSEDVLAFTADHVHAADVVFDVVAFPAQTPLIRAGSAAGKQLITGAEVIALQAASQFERYTGFALTPEQVARASTFSREE